MTQLLQQQPCDRLGSGGVTEVKGHEFFEGVDWEGMLRRKAEFVPQLGGEEDTSYFDCGSGWVMVDGGGWMVVVGGWVMMDGGEWMGDGGWMDG